MAYPLLSLIPIRNPSFAVLRCFPHSTFNSFVCCLSCPFESSQPVPPIPYEYTHPLDECKSHCVCTLPPPSRSQAANLREKLFHPFLL